MKLFFRRIHLYLGLVSGLFLVVVCLTGSILVFEEELTHAFHRERYFVETATTPRLSLAQLRDAVHAYKPKGKISSFKVYADPARTVEVSLAGGGQPGGPGRRGEQPGARRPADQDVSQQPRSPEGPGEQRTEVEPSPDRNPAKARNQPSGSAMGGPGGKGGKGRNNGPRVFVNPYTGAILGEVNPQESFFHFMEQIHRGLVAGQTGKLIMGINSIIFLFILGTGLVLWWPTASKALTQRLKVKWGSGWKRLNHDFHIVLGFYTSLFLFVMALTGVSMSFNWVGSTINTLTHSPQQRAEPPPSTAPAESGAFEADAALAAARQQIPVAESYLVQLPRERTSSVQVTTLRTDALTERATDEVYFDRYSGQVLRQTAYAQQPLGQRIKGLFKPVHTGAIFGWPSKVLAFVVVLLGATFPVTGTILWLNRTRKAKKKTVPRGLVTG